MNSGNAAAKLPFAMPRREAALSARTARIPFESAEGPCSWLEPTSVRTISTTGSHCTQRFGIFFPTTELLGQA
jgi:hypothetical protein